MERQEEILQALLTILPAQASAPSTEEGEAAVPTDGEETAGTAPAERQPGVLAVDARRSGAHLDVLCPPGQIVDVTRILDGLGLYLETITGLDWPEQGQIELLYDYSQMGDMHPCRVLVRARVSRLDPVVPSISSVFPGADWHERETYDFFGVRFQGHPNLTRILLPEDADFHPLLKDYMP